MRSDTDHREGPFLLLYLPSPPIRLQMEPAQLFRDLAPSAVVSTICPLHPAIVK
jgi:hypothetical protein